jgi:(1->4)-alpha-D-glucan 1-alpha-D-glucosylmutase
MLVDESIGLAECLDRLASRKHDDRPLSTYRLQFNRDFRFEDARLLIPYLHALGISHCYASPVLKARSGSPHGYDITDHNAFNPEIGSEEEFRNLVAQLRSFGMGLVLDTVPNHMGIGEGDNPWWQDVLQNGRTSAYASFFDIDWTPLKPELTNRVLYPLLAGPYGAELEQGRIQLGLEDGRFFVQYYDKRLPVDPQTIPLIFEPLGDLRVQSVHLPDNMRSELENILFQLRQLPPNTTTERQHATRRQTEAPVLVDRLAELASKSPEVRNFMQHALKACNGIPGNSRSFDCLHRVLDAQVYRLAHWQVSGEEINYRRFFDINELVGLRMENPEVFAATHKLMRKLLSEGCIDGVRLDHPDGLLNPAQYFTRLQMLYAASQCCGPEPIPPVAENGIEEEVQTTFGQHDWMAQQTPLYVLVEKILEPGERLPKWPVEGTVGYEFANLVNGIFIDRKNLRPFTRTYERFTREDSDPETVVYNSKKLVMNTGLAGEIAVLTHLLDEISSGDRRARDYTLKALRNVIRETIACFPVYRTYIDERGNIGEQDRGYILSAIARAKRLNEATPGSIFDFLRNILLLHGNGGTGNGDEYRRWLYFTLKFQQTTGPVMAKGLEDTACYVYNRFVAVNEVGGSPGDFGVSVEEFHRGNLERTQQWPHSMLATSTHDSKRSEDVRARLDVLSEMPTQWSAAVMRWRRANQAKKVTLGDGRTVPDANEEYLLYQTLIGAWPPSLRDRAQREEFTNRIQRYMNKAVHEAKKNLSWVNDNPDYVAALNEFISRALQAETNGKRNAFLAHLKDFVRPVAFFGAMNSLAQIVLKITAPGVPDVYQGNELWEFRLVDPDNRYSVDFAARKQLLESLQERAGSGHLTHLCRELLSEHQDGRIKLWTTMRGLNFRQDHSALFRSGNYIPLSASNDKHDHLVAFARVRNGEMVIVAVPRLSYALMRGRAQPPIGDAWGNAELVLPAEAAGMRLVNIFTNEIINADGRALPCRDIFAHFPVAVLASY